MAKRKKRLQKNLQRRKRVVMGVGKGKEAAKREAIIDKLFAEYDAVDKARAAEVDEQVIRRLTGRESFERVPPKSIRFQAPQGQTRKVGGHRS